MFINQSVQAYSRPMMPSSMHQQLRKKALSVLGPKILWMAVGKVLLFFCPLFLLANFWLTASASRLALVVEDAEKSRYVLMDEHIKLRAERARLYSPEYLNKIAASQLALYVPGKEQITRF
ncbi:MAG: hypothetical protein PHZ02_00175 [Desulfocapsaceae bacterium]|nr:hypothetical protein [Desulfocapsaceae bacterium]